MTQIEGRWCFMFGKKAKQTPNTLKFIHRTASGYRAGNAGNTYAERLKPFYVGES